MQANAFEQMVRPLAMRLAGPAIGGVLVAVAGTGTAFAIDAGTFLVSALAPAAIRARPARRRPGAARGPPAARGDRVRALPRLAVGDALAAALSLLCFWGPVEVLLPYVIKNDIGGSASDFGLVLAVGGVGAVLAAVWMGRRPLPRRHVLVMYLVWALGCASAAGFALAEAPWQAMIVNAAMEACFAAGAVIWITIMQRSVPHDLRGRVSSVDWMVSFSLMPLSFLLVGPIASRAGADATLVAGGALAALGTIAFLPRAGRARARARRRSGRAQRAVAAAARRRADEAGDDPEPGSTSGCHWTPSAQRARGRLDRLHELVERRSSRWPRGPRRRVDALVVVGLRRVHRLAARARGERARREAHVVVGVVEGAGDPAVVRRGRGRRAGAG